MLRVATLLLLAPLSGEWVHPLDFPQPESFPEELVVVVEIPAGSAIKYETDRRTGHVVVDRFVSAAVAAPANYGSISRTLMPDGDPLDALVLTRAPLHPGALVTVRPLGLLRMQDGGDRDDKIVAVPVSAVDPQYDDLSSVEDLPAIERERLEAFFASYKSLPRGRHKVEMNGYGSREDALALARRAHSAYEELASAP